MLPGSTTLRAPPSSQEYDQDADKESIRKSVARELGSLKYS